jgi:hypothetical protein
MSHTAARGDKLLTLVAREAKCDKVAGIPKLSHRSYHGNDLCFRQMASIQPSILSVEL